MDIIILKKIQKLTIAALVSDETLMGSLVLKGGNALGIAYDIHIRGSLDIDFSISGDLDEFEQKKVKFQAQRLLEQEFVGENLKIFDFKFYEKPDKIAEEVKDFWGGYKLEFKVIDIDTFNNYHRDKNFLRRNAIVVNPNNSTKFTVDISKYEYIEQKKKKDIDGSLVYVYTPEMIAIEKLRALCQQISQYKKIVPSMTAKSRARDFYDIFNLVTSFNIDFRSEENIELAKNIFNSKKVPLEYISELENYKDFHAESWSSVLATIDPIEETNDFDFYFNFVIKLFKHLPKSS